MLLKLVSIVVLLILSVLGVRALDGGPSSPTSPTDIARTGITRICAEEDAVGAANGRGPVSTALGPDQLSRLQQSDPSGLSALRQAMGGALSCPTTTTGP